MKKIYGTLFVLLLLPAALSAQNVIDGRIIVASEGDLPQGLFAKAAGYLPGDTIAVTNPSNGLKVDVLNLGTLDYDEGVTVIISEEAASVLGISAEDSLNAELSLRGGIFDEAFSGTARIARNISVPEVPAQTPDEYEDYVDSDDDFLSEKRAVEQPSPAELQESDGNGDFEPYDEQDPGAAPEDENNGGDEGPLEAFDADSASPAEEYDGGSEHAENLPDAHDENDTGYERFDAESAPAETPSGRERAVESQDDENEPEADFSDEEMYNAVPEAERISPDEPPALHPVIEIEDVPDDSEGEDIEPYESVSAEEPVRPVAEDLPGEAVEPFEAVIDEAEPADVPEDLDGEDIEPYESVSAEEPVRPVAEDLPGEAVEPFEDVEEEGDIQGILGEPQVEIPEDDGTYAPIVLVPAENRAPESGMQESDTISIEPVPAHDSGTAGAPVAESHSISSRTVREQDLQKGSYYVQIATMSNTEYIESLLDTYSKYPVVLVPVAGGSYRVLVGPLSVDEYGVVLAKFKAFGFKDAFLRLIK